MKIKKIFAVSIMALIITLAASTNVFAAESWGYSQVTIPELDHVFLSQNVTASQNWRYVMHYVHNFSTEDNGDAAVHSKYYALYDGTTKKISGSDIKMTSAGGALWRPTNYLSSMPAGWNINKTERCTGTYTTSNYCAIQGSAYNLKIENDNWLYRITLNGQFTFTN